jgi:hypothetical protein
LSQLVALEGADGAEPVNMQQIATWVSTVAMATDPVINALLRRGLEDDQPPPRAVDGQACCVGVHWSVA